MLKRAERSDTFWALVMKDRGQVSHRSTACAVRVAFSIVWMVWKVMGPVLIMHSALRVRYIYDRHGQFFMSWS